MRYEPPIDRTRLIETVRALYGLPVDELTFVPVGYASACYSAECAGGARYFLKLWTRSVGSRCGARAKTVPR